MTMTVDEDLEPLTINPEESIRTALKRLNNTPALVQLVVDKEGSLIGMITDGDIRRALVGDADLDSPVTDCMNPHPVVAHDVASAVERMTQLNSQRRNVPIVDEAGRLKALVVDTGVTTAVPTALIMAGGFGKRMGGHTRSRPKPLALIRGRPILGHLIDRLAAFGVSDIHISVHYLKEQVEGFVKTVDSKARVHLVEENTPLGTAGALGLLPDSVAGPLFVFNGDILTRADLSSMAEMHHLQGNDATIGAARYEVEIPYGVLTHTDDLRLTHIVEKPRHRHQVAAGLYILEPSIYRMVTGREPIDMPDLLQDALNRSYRIGMFPIHEYWLDIAQPSDLETAEVDHPDWS